MTEGRDPMGRQHCMIPIRGTTKGISQLEHIVSCILVVVTNLNSTYVLMSMISIVVVTNGSWFPAVLPILGALMSTSARTLHHTVQGHKNTSPCTTRSPGDLPATRLLLSIATDSRGIIL